MRVFKYRDQGGTYTFTEDELRVQYYPYWKKRMEAIGKAEEATFENCIEDWIVVNWAEEIYDNKK